MTRTKQGSYFIGINVSPRLAHAIKTAALDLQPTDGIPRRGNVSNTIRRMLESQLAAQRERRRIIKSRG